MIKPKKLFAPSNTKGKCDRREEEKEFGNQKKKESIIRANPFHVSVRRQ
jgi:hypothetical protein